MKTRRLLGLMIALTFSVLNLSGQSRENKSLLSFKDKSEKLSKATGWALNKQTGKWIENKNVIDTKECPPYWISHVSQNFKWLQFAIINKDGTDYYAFLYERLGGEYKYPNIMEDWETDLRTHFLIMTSEQYFDLKKQIELKSGTNIKISSKIIGTMTDRFKILKGEHLYNEENLLAKITKAFESPSYGESCLMFNSQTVDGVDVVRFRLLDSCYSADRNFSNEYFETTHSDFLKILTK